jgi:hypothetical protein
LSAAADNRFGRPDVAKPHDRIGDDAIVNAALPPASTAARKKTHVGGHKLLLNAWSGSVATTCEMAALSAMEQSVPCAAGCRWSSFPAVVKRLQTRSGSTSEVTPTR